MKNLLKQLRKERSQSMQTEQLLIYLFISIGSIAYTYFVTKLVLNRAIKLAETIAIETAKQILRILQRRN